MALLIKARRRRLPFSAPRARAETANGTYIPSAGRCLYIYSEHTAAEREREGEPPNGPSARCAVVVVAGAEESKGAAATAGGG